MGAGHLRIGEGIWQHCHSVGHRQRKSAGLEEVNGGRFVIVLEAYGILVKLGREFEGKLGAGQRLLGE